MGNTAQNVRVVGRYALYQAIAAGGMATVHLGRLLGPVGFSRTVAIKRLHAQFASDPEFVSMFLDEARLAARIRHPNVVPTLDVVATGGELFLVMEYVPGESIARLARALRDRHQTFPLRILSAVMAGVLHGLHAAHEAKDERGHPLSIVHRDMSPQNVLVGADGVARILDFGVAKAAGRMQTTREGQIKGKLSYMPPEQLRGGTVSRQSDIYAAGVILWELVSGQRLYAGDNEGMVVTKVLQGNAEAPSKVLMRTLGTKQTISERTLKSLESLDAVILRALSMDPADRFPTAREMAVNIERQLPPATGSDVADWLEHVAHEVLDSRAAMVAEIESSTTHSAAEPASGHVNSVLSAAATISPNHSSSGPAAAASSNPSIPSIPPAAAGNQNLNRTLAISRPPPRVSYANVQADPPVTQPSSISVATGSIFPRSALTTDETRKRTMIAGGIGVMLGGCVLVSVLVWRQAHKPRLEAEPEAETAAAAAVAPSASVAVPGPVPVPAADPAVVAQESVDAAPAAPIASTRGPRSGAGTRPASRPPSSADCATPYWFDAQNVKHYKPQCFDK